MAVKFIFSQLAHGSITAATVRGQRSIGETIRSFWINMTAAATDTFGVHAVFPFVCVAVLFICWALLCVQQISEAYQVSFCHPNCCFPPADGSMAASLCWSCPGYFFLLCQRTESPENFLFFVSESLFLRLLIHHRVLERCLILERCIDKAWQWRQSSLYPP